MDALNKNVLTLIVSLPENSAELAKTAEKAGADALKVHINVKHKASETKFGTFEEEKSKLSEIVKAVKIPVGIVPGEETCATEEEMENLRRMGFDFFDMYLRVMPSYMLQLKGMAKVVAIDEKYTVDKIFGLRRLGADALEAAIVPESGYGKELTVGDLQHYITLAISTEIPVIVPSQRAVKVSEVPIIHDTGVKGLMIGAIITGTIPKSIAETTAAFRVAVDNLET